MKDVSEFQKEKNKIMNIIRTCDVDEYEPLLYHSRAEYLDDLANIVWDIIDKALLFKG